MRIAFTAAALLALASSLPAQEFDFNVTKLAKLDQHYQYSNIWGWSAPDGREYAIMGENSGTCIINATDPLNPYEVAYFPGTACLWREIKARGQYVYVVNDCAGGVLVIDMADPEHPVIANEFGMSFFQHAHTVQIDMQTGKLYADGTAQGMVIYDLAVDPVNPPYVTKWKGQGLSGVNGYVHDIYIKDGVAHAGLIYDGLYVLLDVSNLPAISVLGSKLSGQEFTHSTWTTEDGKYSIVADEKGGPRNLEMWDVSDPTAPKTVADLSQGPNTVGHNPYIRGNVAHVSYYKRGYLAFDVSDPTNPVKIGEYDTTPGGNEIVMIAGAWGVYPFAPSGFIYVSDIYKGFYLLKLNPSCPPDPSGRPVLCEVWPGKMSTQGQAAPKVLLTGGGMLSATAVHVGPVTLGPGEFSALDDQVLAFSMPALAQTGLVAVTIENAQGVSDPLQLPLQVPGGPELDSGASHVAVGGSITHVLDSDAGDLQFLALSLDPSPSHAPKVDFAIGAGFTSLVLFPPLVAGPDGITALPPLVVPPAGAGLTVYWQFAAVPAVPSGPAPVSNVTISVLEP
jgi:choice-of-anchor B domain-containing protein